MRYFRAIALLSAGLWLASYGFEEVPAAQALPGIGTGLVVPTDGGRITVPPGGSKVTDGGTAHIASYPVRLLCGAKNVSSVVLCNHSTTKVLLMGPCPAAGAAPTTGVRAVPTVAAVVPVPVAASADLPSCVSQGASDGVWCAVTKSSDDAGAVGTYFCETGGY